MKNEDRLDKIREAALDGVDKADKRVRVSLMIAGTLEGIFLLTYLALMDFGDRLHWLIFVAACFSYFPLVFGLYSSAMYVNLNTQRILKAINLQYDLADESSERE